mmetsp:Transcript_5137/g.18670  ORF Transcript_5137/g.18670 Transcript_5137/m.18670 type:complete len:203 (+) Transcript_5137:1259-1867(+)
MTSSPVTCAPSSFKSRLNVETTSLFEALSIVCLASENDADAQDPKDAPNDTSERDSDGINDSRACSCWSGDPRTSFTANFSSSFPLLSTVTHSPPSSRTCASSPLSVTSTPPPWSPSPSHPASSSSSNRTPPPSSSSSSTSCWSTTSFTSSSSDESNHASMSSSSTSDITRVRMKRLVPVARARVCGTSTSQAPSILIFAHA